MPNGTVTTSLAVTFALTSNPASRSPSGPPYTVTGCSGTYMTNTGGVLQSNNFSGFNALSIGTPQSSGAAFSVSVTDLSYNPSSNPTSSWISSIGNWALVFIPRPGTTQASPFGIDAGSALITGTGGTLGTGTQTFLLPVPSSVKIQALGNNQSPAGWDWSLIVQVTIPGTPSQTCCFSSDPEMDVSS